MLKVNTPQPPMDFDQNDKMPMDNQFNDEEEMGDDFDMGEDFSNSNKYEADFDAGVEADEEEDPKRFIEQLSGKLSQSLRSYQSTLPKPDAATAKYAAGMVVKAAIEGLSSNDVKDILNKISDEDNDDVETESNDENMKFTKGEEQQMEFDGNESRNYDGKVIDEIYNDITQTNNDKQPLLQRTKRNSYRKKPFVAPDFQ